VHICPFILAEFSNPFQVATQYEKALTEQVLIPVKDEPPVLAFCNDGRKFGITEKTLKRSTIHF